MEVAPLACLRKEMQIGVGRRPNKFQELSADFLDHVAIPPPRSPKFGNFANLPDFQFGKIWRACSRLYRRRFLQRNIRCAVFFNHY